MILEKKPSNKILNLVIYVTIIPFVIITLAFCINELRLVAASGFGVLDLELAWNSGVINTILTAWGSSEMQTQTLMTFLDIAYAPCYGLFGLGGILWISRKLSKRFLQIGTYMSFCTVIAGIFDEIENINLLLILGAKTSGNPLNPFLASLCASLKIGFIGAGLSFLFIAFVYWIVRSQDLSDKYLYIMLYLGGSLVFCFLLFWNLFVALLIGVVYLGLLIFVGWWIKES